MNILAQSKIMQSVENITIKLFECYFIFFTFSPKLYRTDSFVNQLIKNDFVCINIICFEGKTFFIFDTNAK